MKTGSLKSGATKSLFVNSIYRFTSCIAENQDIQTGYSFFRGIIYSYDDTIHLSLLGSNSDGRFRIVKLRYVNGKCTCDSRGVTNLGKIAEELDSLLSVIEQLPFSVSKIYFDFTEKINVLETNCYLYEDLDEVGSNVILVEAVKNMVDLYMLKNFSSCCMNTLLCDNWSDVYFRLLRYEGTSQEREWFKKRGVRLG